MESLINKKVEPFTVQAFHNGELKDVSDTDLQGHWSVIFFYPADFTFVCPTELEDLSDHYDQFRKLNCEIYSVSTDSAYVHKAWADASKSIAKIRYPMLSDSATWLSRFFGVYIEETGQALRGTFIINPQGEIKAYEVHDLGIGRNADELVWIWWANCRRQTRLFVAGGVKPRGPVWSRSKLRSRAGPLVCLDGEQKITPAGCMV